MIFLDMDGVLADFVGGVLIALGRDVEKTLAAWPKGEYNMAAVLGISNSEIWRAIDKMGPGFWSSLSLYGDNPLEQLDGRSFVILTSPSLDPSCAAGKVRWIQSIFGRRFRDYFIGPHKELLAKPENLLIDDNDHNCDSFEAAGGRVVLWPRPWNRNHDKDRRELLGSAL